MALSRNLLPNVSQVFRNDADEIIIDLTWGETPWVDGHFDKVDIVPGIAFLLFAKHAFAEYAGFAVADDTPMSVSNAKFSRLVSTSASLQLVLNPVKGTFAYRGDDGSKLSSGKFSNLQLSKAV